MYNAFYDRIRHVLQPSATWLDQATSPRILRLALYTTVMLACYGFSIGWWRSPLMAIYVAIKLPLLVTLTLVLNGLINGLLGQLLGLGLGFRQSLLALLLTFSVAASILGSLAPITFFLAWNAPAPGSPGGATAHACYLATHTVLVAFAGIRASTHLYQLLQDRSPNQHSARTTFLCWLAGNGFLGAQLSWVLRPFFGTPHLNVQFLRFDPHGEAHWQHIMKGNFYEAVWHAFLRFTGGDPIIACFCLAIVLALLLSPVIHQLQSSRNTRISHPSTP